ncbi:MAG TPA: hypothetical protein ENI82_01605, partial [Bacteroidetes bacterium]|nr:hypothetical protein [Bacteroidota bacterium]
NFFKTKTERIHQFGRGINANISPNEEVFFNKSYEAFEKQDILNAYKYFLKSLENFSNNTSNCNININQENEKLNFEIYQGTAKITGYVTNENLYAQAIVTKNKSTHVALKRYILERNYQLTYAYYCSDDKYIKLKLYFNNLTMSPQKIFFPIREIALNADFDKEYIKSEFSNIILEDIGHLKSIDDNELKIKYNFLKKWINEIILKIDTFPSNDNSGMQAFALLYILFKIDYLLVPKYEIYQKTSKKVQEYFNNENSTIEAKNEELKEYIYKLKEMDYLKFSTNFYNAKYTFNPTEKTSHEEINLFITESLSKIRWYKNNRYNQIIPIIYEYIALYILYNYGANPVIRALLHMLVEIQNPIFFKELNYNTLYNKDKSSFYKKEIISKIEEIIVPHQNRFKLLKPFGDKLNFSTINEFNNSFYLQLQELNFEDV